MKKGTAILLLLALLFSFCGCMSSETRTEEVAQKSLYEQGLSLAALLWEMAGTENYAEFYTGDGAIGTIISEIGKADYTKPTALYSITMTAEGLGELTELEGLAQVSEELKNALMHRTFGSLVSQINGRSGVERLAAGSICTAGKTFAYKGMTGPCIYLYCYENALPIAVTFVPGEDDTVSASGTFIMYEAFPQDSMEAMKEYFGEAAITVEKLELK